MKRMKRIVAVTALALALAGCAIPQGGMQISGKYFKVIMPGRAETKNQSMDQLAALGDMYSTTYLYETEDKTQAYAVIEMDWSGLINGINESAGQDDAIKEQFANEIITAFGADANTNVADVGSMKGLKLDMAMLSEYGMELEGNDITADVYMVPTDQAIIIIVYGGEGEDYSESNGKDFFNSLKGVNTTTDVIGFDQ